MKVAFNSTPLKGGHNSRGIGTYTRNLLENLKKIEGVTVEEFSDISQVKDADVVHYPFFDLFQRSLPVNKKFPTVVTIHDVIPLAFPQAYPPGFKGAMNLIYQRISLQSVKAIITDSKASQEEIKKHFGISRDKIYPIALAEGGHFKKIHDEIFLSKVEEKYKLPEKFVLFVGSTNYNKNILNIAAAAIEAGIDLVLVGKSFENRENLNHPELKSFSEFLQKYSIHPRIKILGFVEDNDLAAITNLAAVLLLPSLAEGFGLPILGGQACGTPVITSNLSSMPEVAGEGALLVNPHSVKEIASAIQMVTQHKTVREDLIKKGFENVQKFSWAKAAEQTVEVYKQLMKTS